jgi:hypothetical protein
MLAESFRDSVDRSPRLFGRWRSGFCDAGLDLCRGVRGRLRIELPRLVPLSEREPIEPAKAGFDRQLARRTGRSALLNVDIHDGDERQVNSFRSG